MIKFQRAGYHSKDLATDIILGITDGLDMSLWCYVYASIIFVGVLSIYLPVGILAALMGWVLVSIWVTLTSREPLHIANLDDQAVVIFGSIAVLMIATMGDLAASPRGLATILFIMAVTSLVFSVVCYLVGRYKLSRVLELLPFPVVCGFMASIGWLLTNAGMEVAADVYITATLIADLGEGNRLLRLALSVGLGAGLMLLTSRFDKSWILPAASVAIVLVYYLIATANGMSHDEQLANGWLFHITESGGGVSSILRTLSLSDVDWYFVASVIPQMLTIVFLAILYASMSITALKAESGELLNIGEEFHHISTGNVFCAAMCSAPGFTDVVSTSMYKEFGASSRWLPLVSSAVGILIAIFGGSIIGYLPKLLMGATIFLFAFQTMYEWLYQNVRGFSRVDYAIIWIILFTTILVGFMQGIGIGIILTLLLFVFRYSRISAIQSRQTLRTLRSSVERSHAANRVLQRLGSSVIIYKLRGFLFFGTANSILDRIADTEQFHDGRSKAILMDFKRVTGMDISALNTFIQIKKLCDSEGVLLTFSGVPQKIRAKLIAVDAASLDGARPLIFDESDFAVEYLENSVLEQSRSGSDQLTVRDFLVAMIGDEHKVKLLLQAMNKKNCQAGETLFKQGEPDSGLYIIEKGALSAFITTADGGKIRVRKFSRGSLIGELSAYLHDKHRTATVIADEDSVIYHLDPQKLDLPESDSRDLKACIHEMVAMTLAERVSFMNNRLLTEAS